MVHSVFYMINIINLISASEIISIECNKIQHSVNDIYAVNPFASDSYVDFKSVMELKDVVTKGDFIPIFVPQSPAMLSINQCIINYLKQYDYSTIN